jgi:hypothetical protein
LGIRIGPIISKMQHGLLPVGPEDKTSSRRGWIIVACVFLCLALFLHFWTHMRPANETIRLYFTQALVDHGTPSLDPVLEDLYPGYKESPAYQAKRWHPNIDASHYEGRDYMDKAPGLSMLVAPVYGLTASLGLDGLRDDWVLVSHLLLLFGVILPAVLGMLAIRQSVLTLGGSSNGAWLGALVVMLATPYTLYGTLFFGHTLAAALAAHSLLFALKKRPGWAGAMAGAMVLVDTPTALLAVFLGLGLGHVTKRFKDVFLFALAGAPFVLLQLGYNTWLFGDPLTFAYAHKVNAQFAGIIDEGVYGFGLPTLDALWGLTFGSQRGLFFHAPVLLLGCFGLIHARGQERARPWVPVMALSLLGYLLWIAAFADWRAGDSYSPRHLIPLIPFVGVGLGLLLSRPLSPRSTQLLRWLFPGLLVCSLLGTWAPIITFPYAPVAFDAPLFELSLPMLLSGQIGESMISAMGGGHALALLALTLLIGCAFALVGPPKPVRAMCAAIGRGLAVGLLVTGFALSTLELPSQEAERERVKVASRLDDCRIAETLCNESQGTFKERGKQCQCSWKKQPLRPR